MAKAPIKPRTPRAVGAAQPASAPASPAGDGAGDSAAPTAAPPVVEETAAATPPTPEASSPAPLADAGDSAAPTTLPPVVEETPAAMSPDPDATTSIRMLVGQEGPDLSRVRGQLLVIGVDVDVAEADRLIRATFAEPA